MSTFAMLMATATALLGAAVAVRAFQMLHRGGPRTEWLLVASSGILVALFQVWVAFADATAGTAAFQTLLFILATLAAVALWRTPLPTPFRGADPAQMRQTLRTPGADDRPRRHQLATFEGIAFCQGETIVDANRQLEGMLGYASGELSGRSLKEVLTTDLRELDGGTRGNAQDIAFEHRAIRKDGTFFPVEVRSRVMEEGGARLKVMAIRDMTARKKTEERLRESEESYRELAESVTDVFFAADTDLTVTHWNKASEYLTGISARDAVGRRLFDLLPDFQGTMVEEVFREVLRLRAHRSLVTPAGAFGHDATIEIRAYPARKGLSVFLEDITDRIRAEEKVKASLREKEALLKEIHHRVKNNLQIVSSLLSLQSDGVTPQSALEALRDSQGRVRSMAMIHEQLYSSGDLARIEFGQYIADLTAQLFRTYSNQAREITLHTDLEEITLDIDRAIPCGMIVNELLTNCLKHAFAPETAGNIWVVLKKTDHAVLLSVADDGRGMGKDIELDRANSLGLRLIHTLTDQLKGTVVLERAPGTTFSIRFPLP